MKFTLYTCAMPTRTEYEYTWGKHIGNISDSNLIDLVRRISISVDLIYDGTITLGEYYANHNAMLTPLWSKSYPSLEHMRSSILADLTAERPELLI